LLSVAWWDTQQRFHSQVGVSFFCSLFLFLTRRLTALRACFLWFKYEWGFFAQLLRMAAQVFRKILVGFASE
jgi:hypothetical protein